ncbi:MAG TPA: chemotaxis protein CheB, partial [Fontimonas sp.]
MPSVRAQPTLIAVGASAGGIAALSTLLGGLSRELQTPIVIALHTQGPDMQPLLTILGQRGGRSVLEAQPGLRIEAGKAYLAPGGYHLLVERDQTLSLSVDERVCHARPSIDVLFESVADACAGTAIGVVLTGLNADGAQGLARIRAVGGIALV